VWAMISRILREPIGDLESPGTLDLGERFLMAIKQALQAAKAKHEENWEQALTGALRQAADDRIDRASSTKRTKGQHISLRKKSLSRISGPPENCFCASRTKSLPEAKRQQPQRVEKVPRSSNSKRVSKLY